MTTDDARHPSVIARRRALRQGGRRRCCGLRSCRSAGARWRSRTRTSRRSARNWPCRAARCSIRRVWELGHLAWFQEWWVARNRQRERGVACDPDHARRRIDAARTPTTGSIRAGSRIARAGSLPLPPVGADPALAREHVRSARWRCWMRCPRTRATTRCTSSASSACTRQMHAEAACYMARTLGFSIPGDEAGRRGRHGAVARARAALAAGQHRPRLRLRQRAAGARGAAGRLQHRRRAGDLGALAHVHRGRRLRRPALVVRRGLALEAGRAPHAAAPAGWGRGGAAPERARGRCVVPLGRAPAADRGRVGVRRPHAARVRLGLGLGMDVLPRSSRIPASRRTRTATIRSRGSAAGACLRGACRATSPLLAHPRYRNFFEPHRRDIFAGFRSCAADHG